MLPPRGGCRSLSTASNLYNSMSIMYILYACYNVARVVAKQDSSISVRDLIFRDFLMECFPIDVPFPLIVRFTVDHGEMCNFEDKGEKKSAVPSVKTRPNSL